MRQCGLENNAVQNVHKRERLGREREAHEALLKDHAALVRASQKSRTMRPDAP